jgi:hypothetical protein
LLGALLGFSLLARTRFWRDPALFITVALLSLFLFYKIRIIPEHFWMARRFVPVILPGVLLLVAGAALATAAGSWRSKIVRWAIGGVLLALLGVHYLRVSRPILHHIEYEGLIPRVEALAGRFAPDDLLILESRDADGDVHVLGPPLAFIYDRNVLLLSSARPDKAAFAAFIAWARAHYRGVYFIGGGGTDLLSPSYGVRSVSSEQFEVPELEATREGLPRVIRQKKFRFGIYAFGPASAEDAAFELDIGQADDLHVLRFHARESTGERTFRWTRATSYIAVTTLRPSAREVTFVASDGGRPPAAEPARMEVYLLDHRLGTIAVSGGFRPYTLAIPADLAARAAAAPAPVELRIVSTLWNPADVLGGSDDRSLGVMVDLVTIK